MIEKKFICIRCPRGCDVVAMLDHNNTISKVEGNLCKLGIDYVNDEITDPRRIVTSTVKIKNGARPLVSVWTDKAIPKDKIFDLMRVLRNIELEAPVAVGDMVVKNALDLGINVVVSGKLARQ